MAEQRQKFNETNVYRVRRNSRLTEGLFLTKLILKKHGTAQIEGMGECISLVAKLSQILSKDNLAVITKIREENIEREGRREINPKITVSLKKSADFDKLTDGLTLRENWSRQPCHPPYIFTFIEHTNIIFNIFDPSFEYSYVMLVYNLQISIYALYIVN